jgi:hypothetical protein
MYPSHEPEYRRRYRTENRERINANYRAAYRKNPNILARVKANYDSAAHHAKHVVDPRRRMLTQAKHRAKVRGIPFDLSIEDFHIPEFCPALGIKLAIKRSKMTDSTPTLDRLKPELGYTKGNVAVISLKANRIKNDATVDELFAVASWLKSIIGDSHT